MTTHQYRQGRFNRLFSALESELNVERVYRESRDNDETGIFDNLYQGIQTKIQDEKDKAADAVDSEAPVEEPSDDVGDNTDMPPPSEENNDDTNQANDSTDTDVPKDEDVSLEALLQYHDVALENFISLENNFYEEHRYTSRTLNALGHIKDLGFQYGPTLLKHAYKGVVVALSLIFKALVASIVTINKLATQYHQSYQSSKERIAELRKAIDLITENNVTVTEDGEEDQDTYNKVEIIKKLSSKDNIDFLALAKDVLEFNRNVFEFSMKEMVNNVNGTNALIQLATSSKVQAPNTLMKESVNMPGLVPKHIPGYDYNEGYVESYVYNKLLPGNILFIGHFPKQRLDSREDILQAYKEAKLFMGFDQEHFVANETVKYLSVEDVSTYLDTLDQLCDIGLKENEKLARISKAKRDLKIKLTLYMKYLSTVKNKVSIEDSLAEYISLKIKYFDNIYIKGSNAVYEYNTQYIASSLTYLSACLKRYA